ncbi:hypothetical protein K353_04182 [Kitasatospora sp. SolWspMP-SS2h]|nr:hypothetical protein [Kitasatospora sp. SolWspMP-SS2h]RAJ38627.1 hypothetical protein K353_04182 [Kitasatospora sp. SolWspMP-SS2h]
MTDHDPDFHNPEPQHPVVRAVPHPGELDARGIPLTCAHCHARRD